MIAQSLEYGKSWRPAFGPPVSPLGPVPRIGGTAMPGGVHFSTGNYGTGPNIMLFLTGVVIILLGGLALALAYVLAWVAGLLLHQPLAEVLLGLAGPGDFPCFPPVDVALNLLVFFCFLVILRLSPLSGYHGAEHKVVHCLEQYGVLDWRLARLSPRAHRRCGTTLLAGLLPVPLIALPLAGVPEWGPLLAVTVAVLGWAARYPVGYAVQQAFTTKEPTDRQLAVALRAAGLLLERWRRQPDRRLPLLHSLWVRGFPQMVAGVVVCMQLLEWVRERLPFWLNFDHVLR